MAHPVDCSRAEGIGIRRTVSVCGQHGICQSQTSNLDRLGVGGVVCFDDVPGYVESPVKDLEILRPKCAALVVCRTAHGLAPAGPLCKYFASSPGDVKRPPWGRLNFFCFPRKPRPAFGVKRGLGAENAPFPFQGSGPGTRPKLYAHEPRFSPEPGLPRSWVPVHIDSDRSWWGVHLDRLPDHAQCCPALALTERHQVNRALQSMSRDLQA